MQSSYNSSFVASSAMAAPLDRVVLCSSSTYHRYSARLGAVLARFDLSFLIASVKGYPSTTPDMDTRFRCHDVEESPWLHTLDLHPLVGERGPTSGSSLNAEYMPLNAWRVWLGLGTDCECRVSAILLCSWISSTESLLGTQSYNKRLNKVNFKVFTKGVCLCL